ncbi:uncharacterized protein LOC142996643 [Genypterus blacodes]|uniref:uncharacterized protein LOC142996643 n=1 Tax=Genypterus blacodes TaxID=154954 RepID=UPI003F76D8F6
MDVESLKQSGSRRKGCLDACLVISIVFLFVVVSTVAAGGVLMWKELRSRPAGSLPPFKPETSVKSTADMLAPGYKMQNFAYLEATSSELNNSTMRWTPVEYGASVSVGSAFSFDQAKEMLQPVQGGMYFVYLDLHFTCTGICTEGIVTVSLDDKLTCKVSLPAVVETPVSQKCWTVSWMKENTWLLAHMSVPEQGLKHWKLEIKDSGLGIFLVD